MSLSTPDLSFGSAGAMVSAVPVDYQVSTPIVNDPGVETHFMGGRVAGVQLVVGETPAMVVTGFDHWLGRRGSPRTVSLVVAETQPGAERHGMTVRRLSDTSQDVDVLATCQVSAHRCMVLVRLTPQVEVPVLAYQLWTVGGPTLLGLGNVGVRTVADASLRDGDGGVRIAHANGQTAVASAMLTKLRVAVFGPTGFPVLHNPNLAPAGGRLSGLTGLFVASVRFAGTGLSIALTAERTLPGVGAVSQPVIVRLLADGTRDPAYGEDGMWVAPLGPTNRSFRCVGETANGVAGYDGSRLVLFGVVPDGGQNPAFGDPAGGLDGMFGVDGVATVTLPGQVRHGVVLSDRSKVWVAAQHLAPAGGQRVAVAKFAVSGGALEHGFGDAGVASIDLEEPVLELGGLRMQPARLAVHPNPPQDARLMVGVSRGTDGVDCTHLPTLVALSPTMGHRVQGFGYGGSALLSGVGDPAVVLGDGSAIVAYRVGKYFESPVQAFRFRRITADGRPGELLKADRPFKGAYVTGFTPYDSNSLLVSGAGSEGWVAKVGLDLSLYSNFGHGGFAIPRPGDSDHAKVLGVNSNGSIAVQASRGGDAYLCRLTKGGDLDTAYGINGFVRAESFGHRGALGAGVTCLLDSDSRVFVVVHSGDPIMVGLRRVDERGKYEKFGIGPPSAADPPSDRVVKLHQAPLAGGGAGPDYNFFSPVGAAWLDQTLYLVGNATAGGELIGGDLAVRKPAYPVLVVTSWTRTGQVDTAAIPGGVQEGGVMPFLYWYAKTVVSESSTSLLVLGGGGTPLVLTSRLADGTVNTHTIAERPGPAVFRVTHPGGIDFGFGDHGAAVLRIADFVPSVFAASASDTGDRATFAYVDKHAHQRDSSYRSRFGGLARFK